MSATLGQTNTSEGNDIMASKKKIPTAALPALKIGSRVRCTDSGRAGRIVWANGVSVKITWDDGQQVTWRRDSLSDRPIEFLGADDTQSTAPERPAIAPAELPAIAPAAEAPSTPPATAQDPRDEETPASKPTIVPAAPSSPESATAAEPAALALGSTEAANAVTTETEQTVERPKRPRKTSADLKEKKLSALDAAAKVLAEVGQPMGCQELIAAMAQKGYWTSPGGQTPEATLYSALLREITTKGDQARFVKAGRGKFALRPRT